MNNCFKLYIVSSEFLSNIVNVSIQIKYINTRVTKEANIFISNNYFKFILEKYITSKIINFDR